MMGRSGSEWRSSLVGRAPGAPALAGAGEPRAPFGIPDQRGRGTRRVVPGWFLDEEIEGSKFGSRKNILIFQAIIGAPAEIRTPDPQIRGWQSDADPVQVWVGKSSCRGTDKIIVDSSKAGGTGVVPYLPLNELRPQTQTPQIGSSK